MESLNFSERTVGEIVSEDYRRATVFKKFGVDFCCGGGKTVGEVCEKKGISVGELEQALDQPRESGAHEPDVRAWDAAFLADYVVNVHHRFVREHLPVIVQFSHKAARVHGEAHPELVEIASLTHQLAGEMDDHMFKEESILFPYIKALAEKQISSASTNPFGSVKNPIGVMEAEHDSAGSLMHRIRELSSDYTPPEYACNTYKALYATLADFEVDLHRHVHLENNILFPKAIELETAAA